MTKRKTVTVTNKKQPSLNATQKLQQLESIIRGQQNQITILAEEIDKLGEIVQLVARRLSASNKVANIAGDSVDKVLLAENVQELDRRVEDLKEKGIIGLAGEGVEIQERSFVVGREIDGNGNEIAPRIQFAVMSLIPELKPKFIGMKRGSIIKNEHNENCIEIIEVYDVIPPKKEMDFSDESQDKEIKE